MCKIYRKVHNPQKKVKFIEKNTNLTKSVKITETSSKIQKQVQNLQEKV